jgi:hypothetical protein
LAILLIYICFAGYASTDDFVDCNEKLDEHERASAYRSYTTSSKHSASEVNMLE